MQLIALNGQISEASGGALKFAPGFYSVKV